MMPRGRVNARVLLSITWLHLYGQKRGYAVESMACASGQWEVQIKRFQIGSAALFSLITGGQSILRTLSPPPYDSQSQEELLYHPIASIVGSLIPTIIAVPMIYWMTGRIYRRIAARYKVCQYCAETIKSAAIVCLYCGRDVIPLPASPPIATDKSQASVFIPSPVTPYDFTMAELGDAVAQVKVGWACYNGDSGTPKDYAQSRFWFTLAAKQGNIEAKQKLENW